MPGRFSWLVWGCDDFGFFVVAAGDQLGADLCRCGVGA
ncbi:hypothetical protein X130_04059, partial [Mycobacterium tuberculosis BTB08-022]